MRGLENGVALPEVAAGCGIEGNHAAAKLAASVRGVRRGLFERGNRNVETSIMKLGRTGNARQRMRVDRRFPNQIPGGGIDSINIRVQIAEEDGMARRLGRVELRNAYGRAHTATCLKIPDDATGLCIQRVNFAGETSNKHPSANNHWLCEGG